MHVTTVRRIIARYVATGEVAPDPRPNHVRCVVVRSRVMDGCRSRALSKQPEKHGTYKIHTVKLFLVQSMCVYFYFL